MPRIIILDVDTEIRSTFREALEKAGHECISEGIPGDMSVLDMNPDLVITGTKISTGAPRDNSYNMAVPYAAQGQGIPYLIVSTDGVRRREEHENMTPHILDKPIEPDVLIQCVENRVGKFNAFYTDSLPEVLACDDYQAKLALEKGQIARVTQARDIGEARNLIRRGGFTLYIASCESAVWDHEEIAREADVPAIIHKIKK